MSLGNSYLHSLYQEGVHYEQDNNKFHTEHSLSNRPATLLSDSQPDCLQHNKF